MSGKKQAKLGRIGIQKRIDQAKQVLVARKEKLLTQKELCERWNCTIRTVQRDVRRFDLAPSDFFGISPLFTLSAVEEMERKRAERRSKEMNHNYSAGGIITVAEAKRRAGRGRK